MNATEQARRSDALYYSANDGINRRWLCDKVASLEAALELCNSDALDHLRDFTAENAKLQSENVKLRKLLLDVWNDAMQFDGFWDYVNDDGEIYNEDELPHYYDRMHELGVEVDA